MHSAELALAWDYWRRAWKWLLMALSMQVGIYALMIGKSGFVPIPYEVGSASSEAFVTYGFVLMAMVLFTSLVYDAHTGMSKAGFPARTFTLPLPTWRLVAGRMIMGMASVALLYVVSAWLIHHLLISPAIPLLGPALFLATVQALFMALMWALPERVLLRIVLAMLICAGALWWLGDCFGTAHFPEPPFFPKHSWETVTLGQWKQMGVACILAALAAVVGVTRDRHGEAQGGLGWRRAKDDAASRAATAGRPWRKQAPFRSPAAAQFWYEWRLKWPFMPVAVGLSMLLTCLMAARHHYATGVLVGMIVILYGVSIFGAFPFGLLIGQSNPRDPKRFSLDTFKATRPLSDVALAFTNLKVAALILLVTWVIVGGVILLWRGWMFASGQALDSRYLLKLFGPIFGDASQPWTFVLRGLPLVLMVWGLMNLGATLTMTGRLRLVWSVATGLAILWIVLFLLETRRSGQNPAMLMKTVSGSLSLLGLGGMIWGCGAAWRRKRIGSRALMLIVIAAMACFVLTLFKVQDHRQSALALPRTLPGDFIYLIFYSCVLPLAAFILAPLAMHWNRHR